VEVIIKDASMGKIVAIVVLSHLLLSRSYAQAINFKQGEALASTYFVELPYEKIGGKLVVVIELGGKKRKFLLDTGAPTAITEPVYFEINPRLMAKEEIRDISEKKDSLWVVSLPELKVGGLVFANIPTIVIKESAITTCFQVEGIIGSNLLRNSIVQFDSRRKTITIASDAKKLNLTNARKADLTLDKQNSPVFSVQLGKYIKEMVLFDSGADEFYAMSNDHFQLFRKTQGFEVIATTYGSNTMGLYGQSEQINMRRLFIPELIVNAVSIRGVKAETSAGPNSRIGAKLLDFGVLTLDYQQGNFYFEPYQEPAQFAETWWNLDPAFVDNKLVVGALWDKALKPKIRVGDQITGIDGISTEQIELCALILNSPLRNKSNAVLTLKTSKGDLKTIQIKKEGSIQNH